MNTHFLAIRWPIAPSLKSLILSQLLVALAFTPSTFAQSDQFLTMCGGGTGALPTVWQRITGGINYAGGRVGINNISPQSELHVNGTIRATDMILGSSPNSASLVSILRNAATACAAPGAAIKSINADGSVTCNSPQAPSVGSAENPLVIDIYNEDSITWACQNVDLEALCGDADGCRIVHQGQHETAAYDAVRTYTIKLFMEQEGLPNNYPGKYGFTDNSQGGTAWVSGDGAQHIVTALWGDGGNSTWAFILDYRHPYCNSSQVNVELPMYTFEFMSNPNVKSRFLVYDLP